MDPLIIGIDPGFASMGLALLQREGGSYRFTKATTIRTAKSGRKVPKWVDNAERTAKIFGTLMTYVPDPRPRTIWAIEAESWTRMPSDKLVGMARGAIYSAAFNVGGAIDQYSPKDIKKELCGSGSASKKSVEAAVCELHPELRPHLVLLPKTQREHAADAAACALYCLRQSQYARFFGANPLS